MPLILAVGKKAFCSALRSTPQMQYGTSRIDVDMLNSIVKDLFGP
ncbi:MAG TPA: hypothetical protein VGX94_02290 [Terriglobia bacterium]|nr:hypothetical protein [Terriglobia bacterium]